MYYLSVPKIGSGAEGDSYSPDIPSDITWAGTTTDADDRFIVVVHTEENRDACLAHNPETIERSRAYLEALAAVRGMPTSWVDGFRVS